MPRSHHKIEIFGYLGKDPEMRYTPSGKAVTNMRVAARTGPNDSDSIWFNVTAWENLAEIANNLCQQGTFVYIEGRLTHEKQGPNAGGPVIYGRNDGTAGASFEVTAWSINVLGNARPQAPRSSEEFNYGNQQQTAYQEAPYQQYPGTENAAYPYQASRPRPSAPRPSAPRPSAPRPPAPRHPTPPSYQLQNEDDIPF